MFFILHAKLQGVFISVYGGGVWMWDQHEYTRDSLNEYTRDSLKSDAKEKRRKEIIADRRKKYGNIFPKLGDDRDISYGVVFENALAILPLDKPGEWQGIVDKQFTPFVDDEGSVIKLLRDLKDKDEERVYLKTDLDKNVKDFQERVGKIKLHYTAKAMREELKGTMKAELENLKDLATNGDKRDELDAILKAAGFTEDDIKQKSSVLYWGILEDVRTKLKGESDGANSIKEVQDKIIAERATFAKDKRGEIEQAAKEIFGKALDEAEQVVPQADDPYVTKDGKVIFTKNSEASAFETNVKGTAIPERPIVPLYGVGVGYMGMLPGHAFWGIEASGIWPAMTIQYQLNAGASGGTSFGKVDVTFPLSVRATAIVGKLLNPWVGLYTKVGGEFTRVNFVYNVEDEQPPFKKKGGGYTTKSQESENGSEQLSANIFGAFAGVGAMFINGHWSVSLEYNASKFLKTTIRKYDEPGLKDDGRSRGYVYSGLHHRLLVRLMYMFN